MFSLLAIFKTAAGLRVKEPMDEVLKFRCQFIPASMDS